jgi:predicted Zn-dependent peptidase
MCAHPAFNPAEVARVKEQRLAALAQTMANPRGVACGRSIRCCSGRTIPMAMRRTGWACGQLKALTTQDLRAAHDQWLRPDLARVTVVGDITMEELLPKLEARWARGRLRPAPSRSRRSRRRPPRRVRASC